MSGFDTHPHHYTFQESSPAKITFDVIEYLTFAQFLFCQYVIYFGCTFEVICMSWIKIVAIYVHMMDMMDMIFPVTHWKSSIISVICVEITQNLARIWKPKIYSLKNCQFIFYFTFSPRGNPFPIWNRAKNSSVWPKKLAHTHCNGTFNARKFSDL